MKAKMIDDKLQQIKNRYHAADLMPDDKYSLSILEERAAIYAAIENPESKKINIVSYIRFRLGASEYYGIPYQYANEVIENVTLTHLPCAIDCIAGVINRRGAILTLLDLKKFLRLNMVASGKNVNLIVVEHDSMHVGILADYIVGSDTYDAGNQQPYEGVIDPRYVFGLHQGVTALLNIEAILFDLKKLLNK